MSEKNRVNHGEMTTIWITRMTRKRIEDLKEPGDRVEQVVRRALDALEEKIQQNTGS